MKNYKRNIWMMSNKTKRHINLLLLVNVSFVMQNLLHIVEIEGDVAVTQKV